MCNRGRVWKREHLITQVSGELKKAPCCTLITTTGNLGLGGFRRSPATFWQIVYLFWFTNESTFFEEDAKIPSSAEYLLKGEHRFSSKPNLKFYVLPGCKGAKDAHPPQDGLKKDRWASDEVTSLPGCSLEHSAAEVASGATWKPLCISQSDFD